MRPFPTQQELALTSPRQLSFVATFAGKRDLLGDLWVEMCLRTGVLICVGGPLRHHPSHRTVGQEQVVLFQFHMTLDRC